MQDRARELEEEKKRLLEVNKWLAELREGRFIPLGSDAAARAARLNGAWGGAFLKLEMDEKGGFKLEGIAVINHIPIYGQKSE